MRRKLQSRQGFDLQRIVYPLGELRTDAGNGTEDLLRIERPAQALQLQPTPGTQHFLNSERNRTADSGKSLQPLEPFTLHQRGKRLAAACDRPRGAPVCVHAKGACLLLLQKIGKFPQLRGNGLIVPVCHGIRPPVPRAKTRSCYYNRQRQPAEGQSP